MRQLWFKSSAWKTLWVALRRSPRDGRARRNLARLVASLLIFIVVAGLYLAQLLWFAAGDRVMLVSMIASLGLMLALTVGSSVHYRWEQRKLDRENPPVAPAVKEAIYWETCLLATLLERLGSEIEMEKELPPNVTVITRRVLLERLTSLGMRDTLEPWLLDILLAPDGHWPRELKIRAQPAWECFAVLRWVLGLSELRELSENPKYAYADAHSVIAIQNPEKLIVHPTWDIRPIRNATDGFFSRCWHELTARRELKHMAEEDVVQAIEARSGLLEEGYTGDYLVGDRTISELSTPELWFATVRAFNRWRTLSLMVDVVAGEMPGSELRSFFAEFFTAAHVEIETTSESQS